MECKYAISVLANQDGSCKFTTFDIDDGNVDTLDAVYQSLLGIGIPEESIGVSLSGGKGWHVDVFFDEPVSFAHRTAIYNYVLMETQKTTHDVEFFPTNKVGIKLPLSVHHKTGNRCWFIDPVTHEPIETADKLLSFSPLSCEEFKITLDYLSDTARPAQPSRKPSSFFDSEEERLRYLSGNYPLLQSKGERHSMMLKIAAMARHTGMDAAEITSELMDWYAVQDKRLISSSEDEVREDIKEIVQWCTGPQFKRIFYHQLPEHMPIRFGKPEMLFISQANATVERKLRFLILYYAQRNGSLWLGNEKIAGLIGVPDITIAKALKVLEQREWITIIRSKPKYIEETGGYHSKPNTIRVSHKAFEWSHGTLPLDSFAVRTKTIKLLGTELSTCELSNQRLTSHEEFMDAYSKVMLTLLDTDEKLDAVLSRKEQDELNQYQLEEAS